MRLGHIQTIVKWLDDFEKVKVLGMGGTGKHFETPYDSVMIYTLHTSIQTCTNVCVISITLYSTLE